MTEAFYDIDHLRKMSLGKHMQTSPIRYSIIRSSAPRFFEEKREDVVGHYIAFVRSPEPRGTWARGNAVALMPHPVCHFAAFWLLQHRLCTHEDNRVQVQG